MSDPTFSDIDFKNKMACVWTTLKNHNGQKLTKSIRDILVILFKWSQLSSFYHEQVPRNKSEGGGRETIQKAKARVLIG